LGFSTYFAINFGIIILNIQDNIEESLDILDERYASIYKILETPLFYDSPEIRNVLRDIELSRDAILHIANILSTVNVDITTHDKLEDKIEK
tara:strand:+ start:196 stop:471 length:276 start_codon:yes stop_codon:yes gene_type:complete